MNILTTTLQERAEQRTDFIFRIGMWWRISYGLFRVVLSFFLFHMVGTPIAHALSHLVGHDIFGEPGDAFLRLADPLLHHLSSPITYFLAAYLLFWGTVDIVLSVALLRHKAWAFSISLYVIGLFVLYEMYRFTHTHSTILLVIIIADIVIMWFIRREQQSLVRQHLLNA